MKNIQHLWVASAWFRDTFPSKWSFLNIQLKLPKEDAATIDNLHFKLDKKSHKEGILNVFHS